MEAMSNKVVEGTAVESGLPKRPDLWLLVYEEDGEWFDYGYAATSLDKAESTAKEAEGDIARHWHIVYVPAEDPE